jgi:hypothetical protein
VRHYSNYLFGALGQLNVCNELKSYSDVSKTVSADLADSTDLINLIFNDEFHKDGHCKDDDSGSNTEPK